MKIEPIPGGFSVTMDGVEILRHTEEQPALQIAVADFHYSSKNGQHTVHNKLKGLVSLPGFELVDNQIHLFNGNLNLKLDIIPQRQGFSVGFNLPEGYNFVRLHLPARLNEALYGGGMQFSHLNLQGRKYPIWTCEAGVGRNKHHPATIIADLIAGAGGNYWTTYHPQPVFLTSSGAGYLLECDNYSLLDFQNQKEHMLEFIGDAHLYCFVAQDLVGLLGQLAQRNGIQPAPPDWVFEGGILGIQGGLPFVSRTLEKLREAGAMLTGVWTQDWQGIRMTPTGKRLFWNWQVDESLYPRLSEEIKIQALQNTRWLGYLNPYFNAEGEQFKYAQKRDYLVKNEKGQDIFRLISEFDIGMLDPTNPEACLWFQELIRKNLLELGMRGWMADYGEDVIETQKFFDGSTGNSLHNVFPRLWAKINREAVKSVGLHDETFIFHRSGFSGQNRWYNNQWGGDQLVGWDEHDGFPSAVTGGLSACMSGIQYYHSDAGGYTTLGWYKRTKELLARWSEANAFSPVLRTHEGNRPWANAQPWTDTDTINTFVRATKLHAALAPYLKSVSVVAQQSGLAMMRPFCLKNPGKQWQNKKDAWYLGDDLLVYPVMKPGLSRLEVEIPEGQWCHLFSGKEVASGTLVIDCPLGKPPVFYRKDNPFTMLFQSIREL